MAMFDAVPVASSVTGADNTRASRPWKAAETRRTIGARCELVGRHPEAEGAVAGRDVAVLAGVGQGAQYGDDPALRVVALHLHAGANHCWNP